MIWKSVLLMTLIDFTVISIMVYAFFVFFKYKKVIDLIGIKKYIYLVLFGLLTISLFYFADLLTMHVLPLFMSRAKAMALMTSMHLNWYWLVTLVSISVIVSGMVLLGRKLMPMYTNLKSNELQFQDIAIDVPGVVFQFQLMPDGSRSFPYVSPNITELLGLDPLEVINDAEVWFNIVHPDDLAALQTAMADSAKNTAFWLFEGRMIRQQNGEVMWFRGSSEPKKLEDGSMLWNGIILDITQRKQTGNLSLRISRLMQQSANEIYVFDAGSLRFLQVSQGVLDNLGYSMAEMRSLTPMDLKQEFTRESFEAMVHPLRNGEINQLLFETPLTRKDGTTYPAEVNLQYAGEESPPVFMAVIQDVTERKKTIEALHQAHHVLEQRVEARTNELAEQVKQGRHQQELIERAAVEEHTLTELLQLGLQQMPLKEYLQQSVDKLIGSVRWLKELDEGGIFLTQQEGMGTKLELVASHNFSAHHQELCAKVSFGRCLCGIAAEKGSTIFAKNDDPRHTKQHDTSEPDHAHCCVPIRDKGNVMGLLVLYIPVESLHSKQDETFLHRVADILSLGISMRYTKEHLMVTKKVAEQASHAKSEFLSRMSHELRTPLNAIFGFSQLLQTSKEEPLTPAQQHDIEEIIKASKQLLDLINKILDLARIESGQLDPDIQTLNISELLTDYVLQVTYSLAQAKQISISNRVTDTALHLLADASCFRQIMTNLLSNAVKYNQDGGTVTVDSTPATRKGWLRISVSDTGSGIAESDKMQLFQPFERLSARNSNIEGVGIGLSVTKQLVEAMGGVIGVDSIPGQGSTFWFELPLSEAPATQADKAAGVKHKPMVTGQQKILYIEDNPANLKLVRELLERRKNITMLTARSAEKGLELAETHLPNLILMDIGLPGIDGYQALEILKNVEVTQDIPVVAISADAMPADIERGLAAGFLTYLTKPVSLEQLTSAIDQVLAT